MQINNTHTNVHIHFTIKLKKQLKGSQKPKKSFLRYKGTCFWNHVIVNQVRISQVLWLANFVLKKIFFFEVRLNFEVMILENVSPRISNQIINKANRCSEKLGRQITNWE